MNIYIINTNTMRWPIYEGDFRNMNPNTSYPSPLVELPEPYAWVKSTEQPQFDWVIQGVKEVSPELVDNEWRQKFEVYALTPEQITANQESLRQQNKAQAEALLQQTDWTATVDISDPQYSDPYLGNQPEFLAYRSAVRKIAVNPPITVDVWPVKPDEVWVGSVSSRPS